MLGRMKSFTDENRAERGNKAPQVARKNSDDSAQASQLPGAVWVLPSEESKSKPKLQLPTTREESPVSPRDMSNSSAATPPSTPRGRSGSSATSEGPPRSERAKVGTIRDALFEGLAPIVKKFLVKSSKSYSLKKGSMIKVAKEVVDKAMELKKAELEKIRDPEARKVAEAERKVLEVYSASFSGKEGEEVVQITLQDTEELKKMLGEVFEEKSNMYDVNYLQMRDEFLEHFGKIIHLFVFHIGGAINQIDDQEWTDTKKQIVYAGTDIEIARKILNTDSGVLQIINQYASSMISIPDEELMKVKRLAYEVSGKSDDRSTRKELDRLLIIIADRTIIKRGDHKYPCVSEQNSFYQNFFDKFTDLVHEKYKFLLCMNILGVHTFKDFWSKELEKVVLSVPKAEKQEMQKIKDIDAESKKWALDRMNAFVAEMTPQKLLGKEFEVINAALEKLGAQPAGPKLLTSFLKPWEEGKGLPDLREKLKAELSTRQKLIDAVAPKASAVASTSPSK